MIEIYFGFFVSLLAGFIGSMVGVGGGIINGPFLSFLNYPPPQISATSLIAVFFTSLSSSIQFFRKRLIKNKIGSILAASAIPGTIIGVYISNYFTIEQFRFSFAIILLCTATYLMLRHKLFAIQNSESNANTELTFASHIRLIFLISLSFLAGIVSSSFGVGGGIIFVPCLIIIMRFSIKNSSATSQFALLFTSFSGLLLFILQGKPDYQMGLILSIGSIIGGTLGGFLATRIDSSLLLRIFSGLLIVVSLKLIYDATTILK
jgi:uncharacterized membrane protein YfcA